MIKILEMSATATVAAKGELSNKKKATTPKADGNTSKIDKPEQKPLR